MADESRDLVEGHVSPLMDQWSGLRFLGLSAWWAWIWLCYNSVEITRFFPSGEQTGDIYLIYLVSTLAIALAMFIAAGAWRSFTKFVDRRGVVIAFGILAALSTVLLGFSKLIDGEACFIIAAICTGLTTSFLCLKVGRVFSSVSLAESLTASGISLLFSALLYFVCIGIPEEIRLYCIAALPLISALLLTMKSHDPFEVIPLEHTEDKEQSARIRHMYIRLVVASALVAITAGIGKGVESQLLDFEEFQLQGSIITLGILVIAIFIIVAVNHRNIARGAGLVYQALMILGIAMMIATCFGFNIGYLNIGKESLWIVLSCFMAYFAFRFDFPPIRIFAVGQGVYFLASTLGWFIGALIAPYYGETMVVVGVAVIMAFLVVLVLVYVFPASVIEEATTWTDTGLEQMRRLNQTSEGEGTEGSGQASEAAEELPGGVEASGVAETSMGFSLERARDPHYGLSARELEILFLFAQGRSASWIGDNLYISTNTVRSHLRAIYTKLDVHTRQDLLDFLSGE
ncbi:MAG: helix-turn-helix transcriptional regulator [Coriobacteriaceae bacterium]|nr:helix-turn-helix transcriptional regulator [Coriobacteriaceae bacterium]